MKALETIDFCAAEAATQLAELEELLASKDDFSERDDLAP